MQTLGISDSTPRTESRLRALFWPTIRNEVDLDYITTQGFWICFLVAALTVVLGVFTGFPWGSAFEGTFFFLAALGVRQRSRAAAVIAFFAYLLNALVLQRYSGNGFGVVRIIFLALLFANIRGNWQSARWAMNREEPSAPPRLNQTLGDKISDRLPVILWPKVRIVFYILAALEISALLIFLLVPREWIGAGS